MIAFVHPHSGSVHTEQGHFDKLAFIRNFGANKSRAETVPTVTQQDGNPYSDYGQCTAMHEAFPVERLDGMGDSLEKTQYPKIF